MIPKECKRLAEVDFPIAVVSKHAAREKSIRHGHPSTLHLWWARRPLAACRAMLMALLLPDPCDEHCPPDFKKQARTLLPRAPECRPGKSDLDLRKALLKFIGDFADWDNSAKAVYLDVARGLVKAAHPEETPLVVDPFAGGGSIPLEALRLGCEAFASDLNPVACLILKVMLEDIPRHGPELAEELRRVGAEIKQQAEKELAEFYPSDPDGARPIAYLWARTIRCESPNCGAEIPLARSFWLCKKANRKRALRYKVVRPRGKTPRVEFEIFEPATESEIPKGTVARAKATCPCCGNTLPPDRVRAQLSEQRGGADVIFDKHGTRTGGAMMLAIVTLSSSEVGRGYRLPADLDYRAMWHSQRSLREVLCQWEKNGREGSCPVPDEPLPPIGTLGFRVQRYGMLHWGDLFSARQKLSLVVLSRLTRTFCKAPHLRQALTLALSRSANAGSSLCRWHVTGEKHEGVYSRQALPIVWDFSEGVPLSESTGGYSGAVDWIANVIEDWPNSVAGEVHSADAAEHPLPDDAAQTWFTDPPYYDAVPYADLSDFFLVWMKRLLPNHALLKDPFDARNKLAHKSREAVQDETKYCDGIRKDKDWFEKKMAEAFAEARRTLSEEGIGAVVFAHKTTDGWEALLSGMIRGGWTITGSWPIATEMGSRLRARDSAALATSVHLICRPRPEESRIGDWAEVLSELPRKVGMWIERLQSEGIRGADLVFACIGPALEIYSSYLRVVDPNEREIPLGGDPSANEPHKRALLAYVWQVVGRTELEQVLGTAEAKARNGAAGALEEDARLTALFLWALQSSDAESGSSDEADEDETVTDDGDDEADGGRPAKGFTLIYDVVRRFAQPLGIHLDTWDGRIIETRKGVVRLLPVAERARQLFGEEGATATADRIESSRDADEGYDMFQAELEEARAQIQPQRTRRRGGPAVALSDEAAHGPRAATTLDRVHAAMLLQANGKANALRALLQAEQSRGPDFLRLSNALSALYPRDSEEKRLLDAMLLAVPR